MKITKSELREIIQEVADEMGLFEGLTKAQEKLPEPLKKAILKKQGNSDDSSDDEKEDVDESISEGNAFGAAVKAARENGDSEFVVGGKTYQLREKVTEEVEDTEEFTGELEEQSDSSEIGKSDNHVDVADCKDCEDPQGSKLKIKESSCTSEDDEDDVEEGNAFGAAVKKAREDGETEFEVDGKTYKVRENWSKISLSEKLDRILGNRKVL